jgi:hypothetical protein
LKKRRDEAEKMQMWRLENEKNLAEKERIRQQQYKEVIIALQYMYACVHAYHISSLVTHLVRKRRVPERSNVQICDDFSLGQAYLCVCVCVCVRVCVCIPSRKAPLRTDNHANV